MKILKPGREQKGWAAELICTGRGNGGGGCGALLLVEEDDLFHTYSHHYDGSSENYISFKCLGCGRITDLSDRYNDGQFKELPSLSEWKKKHEI